jgi:cobalamin synthase
MPTQMEMMLNLALIVVSALVIGLIWKERASDEREHLHKLLADRFAFLAGALLIVVALLFQGSVHQVDTWLVIVLVGMILAKIIGLIRAQMKQ